MRFFQTLLAGAAFVAAAAALEINDFPKSVEPGKTYTITYSPADNTPTTFILRQGKNEDLKTIDTLTTTATGGKFDWKVDDSIPNAADYALEIKQGTTSNYIGPIGVSGSDATSAVSSSKVASSTAAPSSSAAPSSVITTVSGAVSSSAASNGTVSSPTLSRTASGTPAPTGASTTTGGGAPQHTGAASTLGSPLALLLGGFAAMMYFN